MDVQVYIGQSNGINGRRNGRKTLRHLTLKTDEANHIGLIGPSGFGKTTVMRGLVESIWASFSNCGITPIIIVFERKTDISKSEKIRDIYRKESAIYDTPFLFKKYGQNNWNYIKYYVDMMMKNPLKLGAMGDFTFGFPNVLGKYFKSRGDHTILGDFGLMPRAFPVRRFVFRPRRELDFIKIDNGWKTDVVDAKIAYENIPYQLLEKISSIQGGTVYGRNLYVLWETKKIRNPDKVLEEALKLEKNPEKPGMTYLSIQTIMDRIKHDKLFTEDKTQDFTRFITNKMINVIDFSRNSELSPFEEMVILNRIVDKAISLAVKYRIPVFFVIDEIQNIMLDPLGRESINKILREGRSLGVTLIYATQYFHGIKDKNLLINGTTHIGIVGRIASEADYKTLKAIAPDIDEDLLLVECYNIDDFEKLKNKGRFKGYFIYGKAFTEYLKYRPPQSL